MKYLSTFSGIEAASVAWEPLGWQPVGFSEIDAFPSAVLKHRFPHVTNFGDVRKHRGWAVEPFRLLVGGSPCQSFSVAGLRQGLADPRGNLMLEFLAVAEKHRPQWILWENVPGVLSSNGGRDFGTLLTALGELGYGWAYRVLDAKHFGVPQRRRRVFLVGYFGDPRCAAAVLFDGASMSGHYPKGREEREGIAYGADGSIDVSCAGGNISPTVTSKWKTGYGGPSGSNETGNMIFERREYIPDVAQTLSSRDYKGVSCGRDGLVGNPIAVRQPVSGSHWDHPDNPHPTLNQSNKVVGGIAASDQELFAQRGCGLVPAQPLAFDAYNQTLSTTSQSLSSAAGDKDHHGCVFFPEPKPIGWNISFCDTNGTRKDRPNGGLYVNEASHSQAMTRVGVDTYAQHNMAVRRLTPVECERLQGFPDNWTAIPWGKRSASHCPDGPRYKALGNSMAVPVMRWIGERIDLVEKLLKNDPDLHSRGIGSDPSLR